MATKTKSTKTNLKPSDFVHLHNHTQYSLLDGLTKIPGLIDYVKNTGMESIAMTDHGSLSGAIEFYKEANSKGIKPIIGMEAYIATRTLTDKEVEFDKQYYHLIILAMNNTGYQNLMKLSTISHLEGFYYKPRLDRQTLEKYNEGLIVLSGCINSEFADALRQGRVEQAKKIAKWYKGIFGDRYYIEIQDHGHPDHPSNWKDQEAVNNESFKIAKELNVKTVITGDAHYLKKGDQEAHEILLCVQTGSFLSDENRMSLKEFELHVADPKDIIGRWGNSNPDSIKATKEIADRCHIEIELGKILIPKFPLPKGKQERTVLRELVYRGLAWRYGGVKEVKAKKLKVSEAKKTLSEEILVRAEYEIGVIDTMGFNGYFLIIADFINWGKAKGIVFGPGRGSAAGSIIAYALRITEIDPLAYDLLFERFLNPDRISMPDIDIDIQDNRRSEVIEYCIEKYGKSRVANIVTFGRMAARNAVRDVARVLQVPYVEADRLAKMIPPPVQGRHIPLAKSLKDNKDLAHEYKNNDTAKEVFDLAVKLEGTIRSHGVHAAGVVIAPDDIVKFTPLEMAQKGVVATQYSMGPIEEIGLLKMDFLGLSNLTIIKNALRIIKKLYSKDIDIDTIPLDDEKTFKLFQDGDTTGVFQLESSGMRRYLKELKPTVFEDIVAMVALYRPGPLTAGLTEKFIARKSGQESVTFDHPLMENALQNTYGVLVYQEQVMQIAKDMCGFTGGEADTLRKAVGKKKRSMLNEMKDKIISGAIDNGVDKKIASKFWTDIEGFADYAFNKSHAACYGLIAYQTAYLKAHYPASFMAALMSSDYDDNDRLAIEITECQHMGIEVLAPDVQESFHEFAVIDRKGQKPLIRFGLDAIKNVGSGAVENILLAREKLGSFKTLEEFLGKVDSRIVNRKTLEALAKSGALDSLGDRGALVENLDLLVAYSNNAQKASASSQIGLFAGEEIDNFSPKLQISSSTEEISSRQKLNWERELLGIYLSSHPLEDYINYLSEQATVLEEIKPEMDGRKARVGGSITEYKEIVTKKGQKMAFVKLTDLTGEIELIVFPGSHQKTLGLWEIDNIILVDGRIDGKNREGVATDAKIIVEDAREITHEQALNYQLTGKVKKTPKITTKQSAKRTSKELPNTEKEKRLYIRVERSDDKNLERLKGVIDSSPGSVSVVLVLGENANKKAIRLPNKVDPSEEFLGKANDLFGSEKVLFQ